MTEAASDETTVMIFSVHGMMADYAQGHFVPILMRRINELFMKRQGRNDADPNAPGWVSRLRRAVPAGLQHAVGSAVSDSVRQWVVEKEIVGGLNWDRTPGFALRSDIRTEIRLNLEGRESRGILAPAGHRRSEYVDLVREVFSELTDASSGERLIDDVVEIPEAFAGPRSHLLPDLVVTWLPRPQVRRVHSPLLGELTAEPSGARGGDHTDFGFALLSNGPASAGSLPPLQGTADFAGVAQALMEN